MHSTVYPLRIVMCLMYCERIATGYSCIHTVSTQEYVFHMYYVCIAHVSTLYYIWICARFLSVSYKYMLNTSEDVT